MNKKELIKALKDFPDETKVCLKDAEFNVAPLVAIYWMETADDAEGFLELCMKE